MSKRRRFSEKDVIRTLIHQGVAIPCYRSKVPITLDNVAHIQREHLHEKALGGPDEPGNCRYSLTDAHRVVTDGTKATTAGSSKHRIAKANNSNRTEKFVVDRMPEWMRHLDLNAGVRPRKRKPKRKWPKRAFPKRSVET